LQRITFDFEVFRNVKYNDKIEFPNVLDLKPFSTDEVLKSNDLADKKEKAKRNSITQLELKKASSKQS
jgi:hypothetical protein